MPITRSTRHKPNPRTAKNRLGLLWLFGWLILGGALLFNGLGGRVADLEPQAVASIESSGRLTKSIEEIQVGDRVAAELPEASNTDELVLQQPRWDAEKIKPEQWRRIELTAVEGENHRFDIVLLRPVEWLQQTKAKVGGSINLYMPEQGLDGPATILSVKPCPQINSGNGEVVTGTITHIKSGVLELKLSDIDKPLGITNNHPIYSVDRRKFLPAGDLKIGETLQLLNGTTRVESLRPLSGNHRVYNLEVHTRHVYHVSSSGVLVHNTCGGPVRRTPSPGDVDFPNERAARREAMRGHDVSTSSANNFERVSQYGSNPNLKGPKGEPWEIIISEDLHGNKIEIPHHNNGHLFPDGTIELPHYQGPLGEHFTYPSPLR